MKYLRKFATEAEVGSLPMPNVVFLADTKSVKYNYIPNGIYIQHTDGTLYSVEEWGEKGYGNTVANGVALVNAKASFVIHPSASTGNKPWINPASLVEGVVTATSVEEAKNDFAGVANTEAILAVPNANSAAAYWNSHNRFKSGEYGYIPSAGELNLIHENKAEINAAMAAIGGTSVGTYIWSSTQASADKGWILKAEGIEQNDKTYTNGSRGILPLNI